VIAHPYVIKPTAPQDWRNDAACAKSRVDFFPEAGGGHAAVAICLGCPVKAPCLEFALATNQEHGIWAGLSPSERATVRRKRQRARRFPK